MKARAKLGSLPNLMDYKNLIKEQDFNRKLIKTKQMHPILEKINDPSMIERELEIYISRNIKAL